LMLVLLIPPFAHLEGAQSVELLSFVRTQPMHIQTPVPRPQHLAVAPARAAIAQISHAHAAARTLRPIGRVRAHPRGQHPVAPIVASAIRAGGATTQPLATAVAPTATPVVAQGESAGRQPIGGYMPLGVNDSPVLDPSVRKSLLALGVHVRLTITVDSAGHTKSIAFQPPLDADLEQQIRTLLASASWDPAVCGGGMTCEGQATITL
ncbi:MAG TPA: hypothetical protein VMV65_04480, partial [Alphaproteobacteria bacterium]|nr:hypothetical protein [Alphaproteobacteria bacterium]